MDGLRDFLYQPCLQVVQDPVDSYPSSCQNVVVHSCRLLQSPHLLFDIQHNQGIGLFIIRQPAHLIFMLVFEVSDLGQPWLQASEVLVG